MRTTLDRFMPTTSISTTISGSSVQNQKDSIPIIVGATCGGLVLIILVCAVILTIVSLKRRKTGSAAEKEM